MINPLLALLENDKKKKSKKSSTPKTSTPKVEEKKFVSQVSRGKAREVFSDNFSLREIREKKQREREENKKQIAALVAAKNEKIENMPYLEYMLIFKSKAPKNKTKTYVRGKFSKKSHGAMRAKKHQAVETGKVQFAQNTNWRLRAENAKKYKRLMREDLEFLEYVQFISAKKK